VTIARNLQLLRVHPHNGDILSVPDHLEIISGIGLLKDLTELQNFYGQHSIYSGTVTVLEFQCNEDSADYQLNAMIQIIHFT